MRTAFINHPICSAHDMGETHPEQPARLAAVEGRLRDGNRIDDLTLFEAPRATIEQLARAHDASYICELGSLSPECAAILRRWLDLHL